VTSAAAVAAAAGGVTTAAVVEAAAAALRGDGPASGHMDAHMMVSNQMDPGQMSVDPGAGAMVGAAPGVSMGGSVVTAHGPGGAGPVAGANQLEGQPLVATMDPGGQMALDSHAQLVSYQSQGMLDVNPQGMHQMDFHHAADSQHALQAPYPIDPQGQQYQLDPQHQPYDHLQAQYDSQFAAQYALDPHGQYSLDQQYLDPQAMHQYDMHGHQHGMDPQIPMHSYALDPQPTHLHSQHHIIDGQLVIDAQHDQHLYDPNASTLPMGDPPGSHPLSQAYTMGTGTESFVDVGSMTYVDTQPPAPSGGHGSGIPPGTQFASLDDPDPRAATDGSAAPHPVSSIYRDHNIVGHPGIIASSGVDMSNAGVVAEASVSDSPAHAATFAPHIALDDRSIAPAQALAGTSADPSAVAGRHYTDSLGNEAVSELAGLGHDAPVLNGTEDLDFRFGDVGVEQSRKRPRKS